MASRAKLGLAFPAVLLSAQEGDGNAFERLYRAYAGHLTGFAIGRGAADPDALAQDVMLKVFQNLSSFEGDESSFVAWMFSMARNRLIDAHRMSERRPQVEDSAPIPEGVADGAEEVALRRLSSLAVANQLAVLTMEQREVVALRMVTDLSLDQVAEIVGRPVSAVKALQRRGLRRLQKEILAQVVSS